MNPLDVSAAADAFENDALAANQAARRAAQESQLLRLLAHWVARDLSVEDLLTQLRQALADLMPADRILLLQNTETPRVLVTPPDDEGARTKLPASTAPLRDAGLLTTRALDLGWNAC